MQEKNETTLPYFKKKERALVGLTLALGLLFLLVPSQAHAATLLGPSDYLSDDRVNETNVVHNVGFVIPDNGHDIVATDYIRIELTNFTAVTAPTSGSGWSGVPTYGVTGGNVAYVTGVTATAGGGIGISGITATNPADAADYDVTIEIANDINGSIVYDTATFDAEAIKESVVASVIISANTSSIEFFGFTSPAAFVTILLDGGVGATTVATGGGNFHDQITGLEPNQNYSIGIYAQDTMLRQTQTVSFIVHTLPFTNHIYSNIVLPTTIELDNTTILQGDTLQVFGRARPLSQVTVFINSLNVYSTAIQANATGWWTYDFSSRDNPLGAGVHSAYGKEVVVGGYTSIFTQALPFNVNSCKIADINCDGFVNLTDFSIMLFYWIHYNPANPRADINNDGTVNLTDFSIMLYYWTG